MGKTKIRRDFYTKAGLNSNLGIRLHIDRHEIYLSAKKLLTIKGKLKSFLCINVCGHARAIFNV